MRAFIHQHDDCGASNLRMPDMIAAVFGPRPEEACRFLQTQRTSFARCPGRPLDVKSQLGSSQAYGRPNPPEETTPKVLREMRSIDALQLHLLKLCHGQFNLGGRSVVENLSPHRPLLCCMVPDSVFQLL